MYTRRLPYQVHQRILTQKAQFYGQLMYAALVAGGHPRHFRPDAIRDRSMEEIIDTLYPNGVTFLVDVLPKELRIIRAKEQEIKERKQCVSVQ